MEMSKKQLDEYVLIEAGPYIDVMYKINHVEFVEVDGKDVLKMDYDVLNLDDGQKKEFEQYLAEFLVRALTHAFNEDKNNSDGF